VCSVARWRCLPAKRRDVSGLTLVRRPGRPARSAIRYRPRAVDAAAMGSVSPPVSERNHLHGKLPLYHGGRSALAHLSASRAILTAAWRPYESGQPADWRRRVCRFSYTGIVSVATSLEQPVTDVWSILVFIMSSAGQQRRHCAYGLRKKSGSSRWTSYVAPKRGRETQKLKKAIFSIKLHFNRRKSAKKFSVNTVSDKVVRLYLFVQ